jgi:hypothetical protein
MTFEITLGAVIATLILLVFSVYKQRQPKPIGSPWGVPWTGIMFLSIVVSLVLLAHLLSFM